MHTIVSAKGKFHWLTDASGNPVNGQWPAWDVAVDLKYELRPSPHQPLVVDVYGRELFGSPQCTYKLILDNGVVLTGRASGGMIKSGEPPTIRKIRMFDVNESLIQLYPSHAADTPQEIDSAVFGVVSSHPLREVSNGFASPSRPFTFTKKPDQLRAWSTEALRLRYCDLEIMVVGTSNYWRRLVDIRALNHESIVGVQRTDGGVLSWEELNDLTQLLSNFLGWLNHCAAPVFQIKCYRKGRLVYRGYDLHPHATVQRDSYSWFPSHGAKELDSQELGGDFYADLLQDLFNGFAKVWDDNRANNGTFHVALQLLRGGDRGGPRSRPSVGYLRDAFTACAILERMLTGKSAFVPMTEIARLDHILCEIHERTVGRDNCVRFERRALQLPASRYRPHYFKVRVKVRRHMNGTLSIWHGPRLLARYGPDGQPQGETLERAA